MARGKGNTEPVDPVPVATPAVHIVVIKKETSIRIVGNRTRDADAEYVDRAGKVTYGTGTELNLVRLANRSREMVNQLRHRYAVRHRCN